MSSNPHIIALLTDFGTADPYVGVMKGVILSRAPRVTVVDLSHEVPAGNVTAAAFLLRSSLGFFPRGTVFLAVVDPGVGSRRKALGLQAEGFHFVGPDNGLFAAALEGSRVEKMVELAEFVARSMEGICSRRPRRPYPAVFRSPAWARP